jgi:hypothetical protein
MFGPSWVVVAAISILSLFLPTHSTPRGENSEFLWSNELPASSPETKVLRRFFERRQVAQQCLSWAEGRVLSVRVLLVHYPGAFRFGK